jgi:hypothetical protein
VQLQHSVVLQHQQLYLLMHSMTHLLLSISDLSLICQACQYRPEVPQTVQAAVVTHRQKDINININHLPQPSVCIRTVHPQSLSNGIM